MKTYAKVLLILAVTAICLGFAGPYLVSLPSNAAVIGGFALVAALPVAIYWIANWGSQQIDARKKNAKRSAK